MLLSKLLALFLGMSPSLVNVLATPSYMNVLADSIGVDAGVTKSNMTLLTTVPDPINCAIPKDDHEQAACKDWDVIQKHVLQGDPARCSGAHLMSIWYNEPLSSYPTKKMPKTGITGGREFKFGSRGKLCNQDVKFVWNDVKQLSPDVAPYSRDDVNNICLKAFYYARKAGLNPQTRDYKVDTGRPHPGISGLTLAICVRARYDHVTPSSCYPTTSTAFRGDQKGQSDCP